ncbi:uncharacterized protein YjiS (DUF1127 family) [Pseudomonas sp. TE6288]|uniref:DUF1127 domain-containing protein n=1 Tax=Pseudomonas soli TaxID=1306993 RepID=A0A2V4ITB6_9PSED|nr:MULTISPECIES: DUF1127 domain-containing protein [Pseudomonas]MBI6954208.1 DUF1127 domain-containing protein [Pseudomonas sp. CCOS 191]MDF9754414.1 uncharacterized protein YjiS (DUF1127 family) [Pseudomonas hunanensis]PMZ91016.1 DUF1127 domain-containing protein [Pseudomonas sp. FW305-42]PNA19797.1 DUF1127 domain-containing protein [Pseudomonas sp. MPR-R1B]PNB25233.1 DUF1127 domain-containing protein [Pseudomonas sp. DP16D-E2]
MGGMSDVRLQLLASELESEQRPRVFSAPQGMGRWSLMLHRWRTRRALLQLEDYQLRDIGISWEQARHEASKPFWRD